MPSRSKFGRLFKIISSNSKDKIDPRAEHPNTDSLFLQVLPPEMRNLVYDALISSYVLSTDPRTGRIRIAEDTYDAASESYIVLAKSSAESLPLVCRQVAREYHSTFAVGLPKCMRFRESRRQARDRTMSLSLGNIRKRLREPVTRHALTQVEHLVIEHRLQYTIIRQIEERFFSSLRRIDILLPPTEAAEVTVLYQMLNFRGYVKNEELSFDGAEEEEGVDDVIDDQTRERVWVFEYDETTNSYAYYRRMSSAQLEASSYRINNAEEARALRSISDARIADAVPIPY